MSTTGSQQTELILAEGAGDTRVGHRSHTEWRNLNHGITDDVQNIRTMDIVRVEGSWDTTLIGYEMAKGDRVHRYS